MSENVRGSGFTILLVEDSENELVFYRRAMKQNGFNNPLHWVRSGDEAIAYLQGEGEYADRSKFRLPSLLLTDLQMPGRDGIQLLQWIKAHRKFRVVPTIMISSSSRDEDIRAATRIFGPPTKLELIHTC